MKFFGLLLALLASVTGTRSYSLGPKLVPNQSQNNHDIEWSPKAQLSLE